MEAISRMRSTNRVSGTDRVVSSCGVGFSRRGRGLRLTGLGEKTRYTATLHTPFQ